MKRVLIDENLPGDLEEIVGPDCEHATTLGDQPSDEQLWAHAVAHGLAILSKDADFFDKLVVRGAPPQVVWVRTGNMRRIELLELLRGVWPRVVILLETADLVEIHEGRIEAIKF